jgi:hypothetical protein
MKRLLCVVLLLIVMAVPPTSAAPTVAPDAPLAAISLTGGAYFQDFNSLAIAHNLRVPPECQIRRSSSL